MQIVDFKIPILMYHEIAEQSQLKKVRRRTHYKYIVTLRRFKEQILWLKETGFTTISLSDVIHYIKGEQLDKIPKRPIVITFDDGYQGNHEYALPVLREFGLTATFFIIVNRVGSPFMMDWSKIKELNENNMSVQSHTMNHTLLGQLQKSEILVELNESKQTLQDKLGSIVDFFSLPHGSFNRFIKSSAIDAGYLGGCTSEPGYITQSSDIFYMNRIVINGQYDLHDFRKVVQCDALFINKLKKKQKFKRTIKKMFGEKYYNKAFKSIYGIKEKS